MKMKKLIKNAYDFGVIKLIANFFHEVLYRSGYLSDRQLLSKPNKAFL